MVACREALFKQIESFERNPSKVESPETTVLAVRSYIKLVIDNDDYFPRVFTR
jgi:hypothetical protein